MRCTREHDVGGKSFGQSENGTGPRGGAGARSPAKAYMLDSEDLRWSWKPVDLRRVSDSFSPFTVTLP